MTDYDVIIKNVEGFALQRFSTRKKFERQDIDSEVQRYEVYYWNKRLRYDETINRKFYNHLRWQRKYGTTNQTVHRRYNANVYTQIKKSKGLFECTISYGNLGSTYYINLTRNSITLRAKCGDFNLDDKSERFVASIDFDFDYEKLLIIQCKFKQKPSGTYHIYATY